MVDNIAMGMAMGRILVRSNECKKAFEDGKREGAKEQLLKEFKWLDKMRLESYSENDVIFKRFIEVEKKLKEWDKE